MLTNFDPHHTVGSVLPFSFTATTESDVRRSDLKFATSHSPKGIPHCGNQVCVLAPRSLQRSVGARTGLLQPMVRESVVTKVSPRWWRLSIRSDSPQYGVTELNGSPNRCVTACWPYGRVFLSISSIPVKSPSWFAQGRTSLVRGSLHAVQHGIPS